MMHAFQVVLVGCVLTFSGCFGSNSEDSTVSSQTLETLVDYDLQIPSDWEVFPKEEYPDSIVFSAREASYTSRIPAVIAVSKESAVPASMDQFVSRNLEEVRRASQDFLKISEEDVDKDGFAARFVEYQETRSADASVLGFYSLYVLPEDNTSSYVVTLLFDGDLDDAKRSALKDIILSYSMRTGE